MSYLKEEHDMEIFEGIEDIEIVDVIDVGDHVGDGQGQCHCLDHKHHY